MDSSPAQAEQTGLTRRRLLGGGAAATALGAASLALPANVTKALADTPPRGGKLSDIKHVVMLMQENRSFDHYFGSLPGVVGFGDPSPLMLDNGRTVFFQPDPSNPDGYLLPWHLDSRTTAAQAIPSIASAGWAWTTQHQAWDNGKMDAWMTTHLAAEGPGIAPYLMGYYTRDDIPFHYALADAFTVLDHYHCAVIGDTGPNRHMWLSGTIDPNGLAGGPSLSTSGPANQFSWTTYPKRLSDAGVSWRIYRQPGSLTGSAAILKFTEFAQAQPGDPLYDFGLTVQPLGQFEYDCMTDSLPTVSWILPPSGFDEHPTSAPGVGATFIAGKIAAIAANPDVWAKTAFILSYDENDGFFDHVAPPTPPPGTPDEFVFKTSNVGVPGGGFPIGLGFRVPCVIVSPWTVGGYVNSQVADHTSQLLFLERITGVKEPNISDWRRSTVSDLTSAFRFEEDIRPAPLLPDTAGASNLAQFETSQLPPPSFPGAVQTMPTQEKGHRPHVS
jgi:phospholipase C